MSGDPPFQIGVCERLFKKAHERARRMADVFEAFGILPNDDHSRVACRSMRAELCRARR